MKGETTTPTPDKDQRQAPNQHDLDNQRPRKESTPGRNTTSFHPNVFFFARSLGRRPALWPSPWSLWIQAFPLRGVQLASRAQTVGLRRAAVHLLNVSSIQDQRVGSWVVGTFRHVSVDFALQHHSQTDGTHSSRRDTRVTNTTVGTRKRPDMEEAETNCRIIPTRC